jgi:hypothetical protein
MKKLFMFMLMMFTAVSAAFGKNATEILKDTASQQVSGDIGWLFIVGGIVIAALTMIIQKNIIIPIIILIGAIVFAMSPDLANGVIQQFGNGATTTP